MDLLDAVVLTQLLRTPESRRILRPRRSSEGVADQRPLPDPEELWNRVGAARQALGAALDAARQR
ncbi:MAG: hypothetical protein OXF27_17965, partial [Acidobacteria bacterium]|nr:hypothetical protein [Acidobacteriota bacterium]